MNSPLSFHADPKKVGYILYQGTKCENIGVFFRSCHDEVRPAALDAYSPIHSRRTNLVTSRMIDILYQRSVRRYTQEDARPNFEMCLCALVKRFQT